MNEQRVEAYLWDRSGEPDEELRRLEALLERYRYDVTGPGPSEEPPVDVEEEPPA